MAWTKERAYRVRALLEKAMAVSPLTDAEASEVPTMFPAWDKLLSEGRTFTADDVANRLRVQYGGKLYLVIQPHKVQADWTPEAAPSLYTEVKYRLGYRVIGEYITAEAAFSAGECGIDADGVVWESLVDNNVYTPVQYPGNWTRKEETA